MLVIQSQQDRGTGACQKMRKTEQNQFLLITLGITIGWYQHLLGHEDFV